MTDVKWLTVWDIRNGKSLGDIKPEKTITQHIIEHRPIQDQASTQPSIAWNQSHNVRNIEAQTQPTNGYL